MAFFVDIAVVPSSGRQQCILDKKGKIKCYLKSAPEKGKANRELIKFFAKKLGVTQDCVNIVLGLSSRKKRLKIDKDLDFNRLVELLGIERQLGI
jgi:uncharacterized protein (TIGR00251 family)